MDTLAVEMRSISKRFGKVLANDHVSFELRSGEVHVLLGENGAGKSTLMNILFGLHRPDEGEIFLHGKKTLIADPHHALRLGIGMVHQHFKLVGRLTVLENVLVGYEPGGIFIDYAKGRREVRALADRLRFDFDLDAPVETLSVGARQRVEIVKTLYRGARLLVFDEPTAVLTPPETRDLFRVFEELKRDGKPIIFITHKLEETMAVADRITVLRGGKNVSTVDKCETSPLELARMMVGRDVVLGTSRTERAPGELMLSVRDLRLDEGKDSALNFDIAEGEILGIAGVEGNGQLELEEAIVGLRRYRGSSLRFKGREIGNSSVRERKHAGIAHIPSDRYVSGILPGFGLLENLLLGKHFLPAYRRAGFIRAAALRRDGQALLERFEVKRASLDQPIGMLSGGNQQKVVLAREVGGNPSLVVAAQPTRGLDVGAIEYVHSVLLELRSRGAAIILISADLQEILDLSDRIAVMYEKSIRMVDRDREFSREALGLLIAGKECEDR